MDTTTKMIVMATKEAEFGKAVSVLSDIMLDRVDEKTHALAISIEETFNEYWKENMWLRLFAGTNFQFVNKDFVAELKTEIESELLETNKISI